MKPCPRINISFLSTSFPRFKGDFSGNFVLRYAQELCNLGVDIEVIAPDDPASLPLSENFSLVRFPYFFPRSLQTLAYGSGIINQRSLLVWLQLPFLLINFFLTALRSMRKTQLVHAFWSASGIIALAVRSFKSRPVVITLWGSDKIVAQIPIISKLIIMVLNRADAIICEDNNLKSFLVSRGLDSKKITLIRNGIDLQSFQSGDSVEAKKSLGLRVDQRIMLSIGSLNQTKNHALLINTFSEIAASKDTWHLYIIGEGEEQQSLEKQILDLKLEQKTTLLGLLDHNSISKWLKAADIFVLPSQNEGTPNALLEAMASGLPVIASKVGGIPELIQDNTEGLLFESGSKDDLKEKLNRLTQDKQLQKMLAKNAKNKITTHYGSWKIQAEQLLELYEQLLSSSKK
jgi:glycosyltransferase involved in cell wall biosynthesis